MLKQRTAALLLAGAVVLALGGTIAAVDPGTSTAAPAQTAQSTEPVQPAAPEASAEVLPDAAGSLSFSNLEGRMRENNLTLLMMQENINALGVLDYKEMEDDLRDALNQIANQQWEMSQIPMLGSIMSSSLQSSYDAVREQFDAIKNGELQEDNDAIIRQLKNGQEQVVMAGETLYAALLSMDYSYDALERKLTALDRQIRTAELGYEQGNVSALALEQARAGRVSLVSGMETMNMNRTTYTMQLESLIGEELTGTVLLQSVPGVTAEEIDAMDMEADYAAAKAVSYELFAAQRTLDEAKESYDDAVDEYGSASKDYNFLSAQHRWQAAGYTYDAAVESYELKFKTLYLQTKDCYQIWEAAKTALKAEEAGYAAEELKFSQGSISQNALLDAQDSLATARESVATAAIDLFMSYHNYRWAVERGILN